MIPRPEFDENIHLNQICAAKKRLSLFKSRLQIINEANGLIVHEKRQLMKLDGLGTIPLSVGYEIVPFEIVSDTSSRDSTVDTESNNELKDEAVEVNRRNVRLITQITRHAVQLVSDGPDYIDVAERKKLAIECDRIESFCSSDYCRETEEEGIEIIGLGRFSRSHVHEYNDKKIFASDSKFFGNEDERFSNVLTTDENVHIIFYRDRKSVV